MISRFPRMRRRGPRTASAIVSMFALAAFALTAVPAGAATLVVPTGYPTIQDAVDAASPGDRIEILAGTYTEQVEIAKDLTLEGGTPQPVIQAPADLEVGFTHEGLPVRPVVLVRDAGAVILRGVSISGAMVGESGSVLAGLAFVDAGGRVEACAITEVRAASPDPDYGSIALLAVTGGARALEIEDCAITAHDGTGIHLDGVGLSAVLTENTVYGPGLTGAGLTPSGIRVTGGADALLIGNEVWDHLADGSGSGPDPVNDRQAVGIDCDGAGPATRLERNTANRNDVGIRLRSSAALQCLANVLEGNRHAGIAVEGGSAILQGNHVVSVASHAIGIRVLATPLLGAAGAVIEESCLTGDGSGTGVLVRSDGPVAEAGIRGCETFTWGTAFAAIGAGARFDVYECSIHDNSAAGFDNTASGAPQSARLCWWGDASGPSAEGNPAGTGELVLGSGVEVNPVCLTGADGDHGCRFLRQANTIAPESPASCLSTNTACVTMPVKISRTDTTPVRGFSVTFDLSSEIAPCNGLASIVQGDYLSGNTQFQVVDNGGGAYTVDWVILGTPCGADAPDGTLFSVEVTNAAGDGTGTLSLGDLVLRDCDNQPIAVAPGGPASVTIDTTPPGVVTDLSAAQIKTGNGADGTTAISVAMVLPGDSDLDAIEVYRAPWGLSDGTNAYPEYDDMPSAGPPAAPGSYPPGPPWALTPLGGDGPDSPPERGYWYYVAFAKDACGNVSAVSDLAGGTLNYHLGDVSDGLANCAGDNAVDGTDVSLLGAHYHMTLPYEDALSCVDIGPTADYSVDALPTTDSYLDFEDLILMAVNYGTVSLREGTPQTAAVSGDETPGLRLAFGPVDARGLLVARLLLEDHTATVKGLRAEIAFDDRALDLLEATPGTLLGGAPFFTYDTGAGVGLDAAVLGGDAVLEGNGVVAELRFRTVDPKARPQLVVADLRDRQNRFLGDVPAAARAGLARRASTGREALTEPVRPVASKSRVELLGARPNPFGGETAVAFRLPSEAFVRLRIYDVAGRLVRTLADGVMPSGEHTVSWDGRTDAGAAVGAGIYLYSFEAGGVRASHKLFRYR